MAVKAAIRCLAAVEAYPRMAYRSRVVLSERSRPLIFCWLGGSQVAFGLVAGRGDGGVGEEPQHVGFAVAQAFQQEPGGRLLGLGARDAADLGQPDGDAAAEQRQVLRGHLPGDRGQALVAGQVGGVDEAAQGLCDLAGQAQSAIIPMARPRSRRHAEAAHRISGRTRHRSLRSRPCLRDGAGSLAAAWMPVRELAGRPVESEAITTARSPSQRRGVPRR
jgi:hypothetical protein